MSLANVARVLDAAEYASESDRRRLAATTREVAQHMEHHSRRAESTRAYQACATAADAHDVAGLEGCLERARDAYVVRDDELHPPCRDHTGSTVRTSEGLGVSNKCRLLRAANRDAPVEVLYDAEPPSALLTILETLRLRGVSVAAAPPPAMLWRAMSLADALATRVLLRPDPAVAPDRVIFACGTDDLGDASVVARIAAISRERPTVFVQISPHADHVAMMDPSWRPPPRRGARGTLPLGGVVRNCSGPDAGFRAALARFTAQLGQGHNMVVFAPDAELASLFAVRIHYNSLLRACIVHPIRRAELRDLDGRARASG